MRFCVSFFPCWFRLHLPVSSTSQYLQERGFIPQVLQTLPCFCLCFSDSTGRKVQGDDSHCCHTDVQCVCVAAKGIRKSCVHHQHLFGSRFTFWVIFSCCYFHSFCGHWGYLLFLFGNRVKELRCGEGSEGAAQGCWEVPLSSAATTPLKTSALDAAGCWRSSR